MRVVTKGKGFDKLTRRQQEFARVREILVVDDSKVMRDMVIACLRPQEGLSFTHAASGLEAIEKLSLKPFDLVILDLNMPDIGGLEVLEFVRGQGRLNVLPILVVTTRGDETSRARALAAGANQFMTKPFAPDALLASVRELLAATRAKGA
jgi:two-component system, chemotaxis family, chemotaxis protein CheY